MSLLRRLWRRYGINPFEHLLEQAAKEGKTQVLLCWNRGLGDIPLGLDPFIRRIREKVTGARITILTRRDLAEGFSLLKDVRVIVDPKWVRKQRCDIDPDLISVNEYDVVIEHPDPSAWLKQEFRKTSPLLYWDEGLDELACLLEKGKKYIAVHTETQTEYGYEKNWPKEHFETLFSMIPKDWFIVLVGGASSVLFSCNNLIDLRGKTTLLHLLSILKNRCSYLVAPDSGILSMIYYLNASFSIRAVSLWADPNQGVLKQGTPSPNPLFEHVPLIAQDGDLRKVAPDQVFHALFAEACV